ncbi:HvfC/BufC N-terminal domain-containing protein [Pseudomonas citronellolis]|uniref:HvfC/BufC N-terminal domain-containing protein n=1 Tax=Pseudomonas citronellolis TaxID=53408 RepID=UPI0023E42454|nr:DNA-binding domain-containing protein [Pseudomonas citronellolis]MDF3931669.1 DNA-binding domain-containing protein [Pseudomonas citronellolis]
MPARRSQPSGQRSGATALACRFGAFAKALLDPALPLPPGLVGPDGLPSARRFGVYRNNVVVGLVGALKDAYPVLLRLLGEAFFCAMAREFVVRRPPRHPVMLDYGEGFAEFLEGFGPVATLPYLADVARLERAWLQAYHAADARVLAPSALQRLDPRAFPGLRLALHPATRLLRSGYPVLSIWWTNVGDAAATEHLDLARGGEDALVTRPEANVRVRRLPPGAFNFIDTLATGAPVAVATRAAFDETPAFDLAATLVGLLEAGALAELNPPDTRLKERL